MDLFDFYKEVYYKELDKKDEINNSLSIPMSIASAMFAGFFFMATTFCYTESLCLPFILLISLSCLLLLIAVWYLFRAYNDSGIDGFYSYRALTNTEELANFYELLKEYHIEIKSEKAEDDARKDFREELMKQMISHTSVNQKNNAAKLEYFRLCRKYLLFCMISGALTLFPFGINYGTANHEPIVKVKMMDAKQAR